MAIFDFFMSHWPPPKCLINFILLFGTFVAGNARATELFQGRKKWEKICSAIVFLMAYGFFFSVLISWVAMD